METRVSHSKDSGGCAAETTGAVSACQAAFNPAIRCDPVWNSPLKVNQHRPHVDNEFVIEFKDVPPCLFSRLLKLLVQLLLFL